MLETDIVLKNPDTVIRSKGISYRNEMIKEFEKQIPELLNLGLIRHSTSEHRSAAFMVTNHAEQVRGKSRMVIDYRDLNRETRDDGYNLPNQESLRNRIRREKPSVYSKFDLKSGYWQIKVKEKAVVLTAFTMPIGLFEWLVMPFGLKNALRIFQRRMDKVFGGMTGFVAFGHYSTQCTQNPRSRKGRGEKIQKNEEITINRSFLETRKDKETAEVEAVNIDLVLEDFLLRTPEISKGKRFLLKGIINNPTIPANTPFSVYLWEIVEILEEFESIILEYFIVINREKYPELKQFWMKSRLCIPKLHIPRSIKPELLIAVQKTLRTGEIQFFGFSKTGQAFHFLPAMVKYVLNFTHPRRIWWTSYIEPVELKTGKVLFWNLFPEDWKEGIVSDFYEEEPDWEDF
ncbi:uncharacterized protein LOC131145783 [Malania oleifera]|uniref:uncharacterized protein LOC131145783 n=1 Tax=Malania oleifera TaxID=397392 RepID=UPI0025ADD603|nr:uncharacterized protein LOC131145783 [Malania oleifera]